ncbi:outer membrane beta-barrel protein [Pseudodesulfovibrio cashew]|uniref:Outer membrane beta-barrel protein n=1 Tax=Pseudodesulfovibrio cashew TaxID=2678688 RepID=A0A6I6JHP3_9BACT|nr:acyloxyacyl hydrolase [Pseudodesulfovibrio cashew]QGY39617.1 outer membrane beta-barrel protein [Pseudodesulfovibrio cashew]
MKRVFLMLVAALVLCTASTALAEGDSILSEIRGGIYAHDISFWSFHREDGPDVNAELLFVSPEFLKVLWAPRPHVGVTINTAGDTSHAYGGLTWEYDLPAGFFVDGSLGLSAHNGHLDTDNSKRKSLGSPVLFRVGAALGYNFTERWNVSVQYEHMSNAYIANPNEGMDNVGLRLGYRF